MKRLKRLFNLTLAFSMMLHMFMPLTVLADTEIVLTLTVENTNKFTITTGNGGKGIQVNNVGSEGGAFIRLLSDGADVTNDGAYACNNNSCTITYTLTDMHPTVSLDYPDNYIDITSGTTLMGRNSTYNASTSLDIKEHINNNNNNNNNNNPGTGSNFDGNAYLVWSCKNGGVCYAHFDDIPNFDDGKSKFYYASTIKSQTNEEFDVNAQYKGWVLDSKFDNWVNKYKTFKGISQINWAEVDPKDMIGDPIDMRSYEEEAETSTSCTKQGHTEEEFRDCVDDYVITQKHIWALRAQLQPVGEPTYKNAYVSYGDRNFKVVIINEDYKGVSIGSLDDLSYYPAEWNNPFIKRDQYDISGTTKDKPTGIDVILLEKTVNISVMDYNAYHITKLEALDVPAKAVTIQMVDEEWKITFASNFYDKVVFKATDSNGGVSYFMIKRYTIDGYFKHVDNKPVLNADFYFDRRNSYSDFELTAKIVYKDGTEKNVTLDPVKGIDDGLNNITDAYEVDEENPSDPFAPAGKGLKKACFQYKLADGEDRTIKKIYLNAEFKGSTDTNYAGAYTGSGEGILANIYTGEE